MNKVYGKPEALKDTPHLYCPGCGHGIIHRLVAEAIDDLNVRERTIMVAPVGCAVFAYDYFNFDVTEAPHGRPPAVATGIKRVMPDKFVFTYQGDGDLASIGMAETIHSANRGENISIIFVNNANYGMTGGQMAPTTILGMKTATSPFGRDAKREGYPMKVCELLSTLEGVAYAERVAVNSVKNILNAKKAIKKAFQKQIDGKGFSLVEVLSQCPVDWDKPPQDAVKWVDEVFMKTFPLGVYKDKQ
jgi:2-oxoglutarate/2-oxoacid ferredoxin oxidoreductase subunit beta